MSAIEQPPVTLVWVGRASDVPMWEGRSVSVGHRRLAVFRTDEGFFALTNACPHAGGPLADGIVGDGCVTCPLHGRRFDLRSGRGMQRRRGRRAVHRRRARRRSVHRDMTQRVRTGCPYCGVGCGLVAEVRDGRLESVAGDPDHPVNRGATCQKPLALPDAVYAIDRATVPLWRPVARGSLARAVVGSGDVLAGRAAVADHRRARSRRRRVLHLRPAADRGLLRRVQAGQGVHRDEQPGLQLAPVHVLGGGRLLRRLRLRRAAAVLRRSPPDRLRAYRRLEHGRLPSDRLGHDPAPAAGRRPGHRRRSPAHRDGRRRRSAPARSARRRPAAADAPCSA